MKTNASSSCHTPILFGHFKILSKKLYIVLLRIKYRFSRQTSWIDFLASRKINELFFSGFGMWLSILLINVTRSLTWGVWLIFLHLQAVIFWYVWAFSSEYFLLRELICDCLFYQTLVCIDYFNALIFFAYFPTRFGFILILFFLFFWSKYQEKIDFYLLY